MSTPELRVERGDRVAIIGQNGSGKSTLLRTDRRRASSAYQVASSFGTNVKMGYYAQGHEGLPVDGSPLSILLSTQPMGEEAARTYLARFLFRGDEVHRPVSALSGGERSRLALACLLVEGANLLILDEPTNHLDIQSRETLEEMLTAYDGTVVFVSHDRYFIDRVATRVWDIAKRKLVPYLGNFSDAARQKSKLSATEPPAQRSAPAPVAEVPPERPPMRRSGQGSESRLQKQLASAERDISRLEARLNDLSDAIAIAGVDGHRERLEAPRRRVRRSRTATRRRLPALGRTERRARIARRRRGSWMTRGDVAVSQQRSSDPSTSPYVVGLTGPIASGKSTVAELLRQRGAEIIDADLVYRGLLAPGSALWQESSSGLDRRSSEQTAISTAPRWPVSSSPIPKRSPTWTALPTRRSSPKFATGWRGPAPLSLSSKR